MVDGVRRFVNERGLQRPGAILRRSPLVMAMLAPVLQYIGCVFEANCNRKHRTKQKQRGRSIAERSQHVSRYR